MKRTLEALALDLKLRGAIGQPSLSADTQILSAIAKDLQQRNSADGSKA